MGADILVVDDEADIRELIAEILDDEGYSTRQAGSSDAALRALAERVPSLLVLDIWLQGSELDGLGILEIVQEKYPELPVVMISGHGNIETAVNAIKMGAVDFVEKPFNAEKLMHIINRSVEMSELKNENTSLKRKTTQETVVIGKSPQILQVKQTVERVAPTNSRVLITGEEGTGKEVIARLIHKNSTRSKGAFVVLNAGCIASAFIDQELFGVEDSNPTGGAEKLGLFERAHGGTLFIDEVADMSLETQGRILKALQESSFTRVRGNKPVSVDVRVIAASNRDLEKEIKAGNFRTDLYYRLNIVPIHVPSLSERREDIPELCEHFINKAAEATSLGKREITDDAMAVLQAYAWPGNVRHLRNIMEWLLIMNSSSNNQPIDVDMLPASLLDQQASMLGADEDNANVMSLPLREAREIFERQYLSAQISRFGGNISKTSNFIGMERSALHRKLKILGIHSDEKISA